MILQCMPGVTGRRARERERERVAVKIKSMTRNTSDALPFVRERLGTGQRLTAPDKLGWNNLESDECGLKTHE